MNAKDAYWKEAKAKRDGKNYDQELMDAALEYPELANFHKPAQLVKYARALKKYPDLKDMPLDLVLPAFDFREAEARHYATMQLSNIADARCDIQMSVDYGYKYSNIPKDLPALNFQKECVVCTEVSEDAIGICQDCWQLLRKCLELKGAHREGWTQWGYEMSLDLTPLVRLLKADSGSGDNGHKTGKELLEDKMLKESKGGFQQKLV